MILKYVKDKLKEKKKKKKQEFILKVSN